MGQRRRAELTSDGRACCRLETPASPSPKLRRKEKKAFSGGPIFPKKMVADPSYNDKLVIKSPRGTGALL